MNLAKENNKKVILHFSIVIFIFLLCTEYIYICYRHYTSDKKEYEKVLTVTDINDYQGYLVENGIFKPQNDDPQILIGDCSDIVSKVTVNFKEPLGTDTDITLYYSKNGSFQGINSITKQINVGDKTVDFNLYKRYKYIRIQINGEFSLGNIELKLVKELTDKKIERNIIVLFVCIDIILLCVLIVLNKEEISGLLKREKKDRYSQLKEDDNTNNNRLGKMFLLWSLVGGITISVLVPAYQTPDEYAHLLMMQDELGLSGYAEDALNGYFTDIEGERIKAKNGEKQDFSNYIESSKKEFSDDLHITFHPSIKILRHFAANIGFFLCVLINLPVFWCLQIAELFSLIFYMILGYFAIKLMPVKKELLAIIMLLPMSLQQAGSINYDATLIPVCFLFISYIMHILYSNDKVGWKSIGFMMVLLTIIALTKPPYVFLAMLILMIPINRYNLKIKGINVGQVIYKYRWWMLALGCVLVLSGIYILRYNMVVLEVVASFIKFPKFITTVFKTLFTFHFFIVSIIGNLGWLDTSVDIWFMIFTIILCIILTQIDDKNEKKFSIKNYVICISCFAFIFCLVFIAMENWTIMGTNWMVENNLSAWLKCIDNIDIIQGVQGRYFIPIIPVVGMLIPVVKKVKKKSAGVLINVYAVVSIIHVAVILIQRYWISGIY